MKKAREDDQDVRKLLSELQVHKAELEMQNEELRMAQQEIRELLATYTDLYDFAPVGYLRVDGTGAVRQANLAAAALLGRPRALLVGCRLADFLDPESRRPLGTFLGRLLAGEEGEDREFTLVGEGFGQRHVRMQGTLLGAAGECRLAMTDVTRTWELERKTRELNIDLERRVQLRTADLEKALKEVEGFSYSVSHDLRSPVRAIDGYAAMLERRCGGSFDDEGRRLLGVIRESSKRMGTLIDDLLAFSRLGRQEVSRAPCPMTTLAESALGELAPDRSRVEVHLETLPPAEGDPGLLREVFLNLLSNALKFSARDSHPRIEVGWRAENGATAYFVRDNGVGFDPRYAGKLFGVFERLHGAEGFDGTGIGLALVKRIVERHGGRVWAEGAVGQGAIFWFTLPGLPARAEVPAEMVPA